MASYSHTQSTRALSLGPVEGRFLTELERAQVPVFSLRKHRRLLDSVLAGHQVKSVLRTLTAKGGLLPVERGTYVVLPRAARSTWHEDPFVIATALAPEPAYVSYWAALAHHGLTTQLPLVLTVALREQKDAVVFQGRRYVFARQAEERFYGYAPVEVSALNGAATVAVNVAHPEKAVLDALNEPEHAGGMSEIVEAVARGVEDAVFDPTRLAATAARYPNRAVVARLGYLLERAEAPYAEVLLPLVRRRGSIPLLSPDHARRTGVYDARWRLRVNLPDDLLGRQDVA